MREIEISRTKKGDCRITDGVLSSITNIGERRDGTVGLWRDGNLDIQTPELEAAIMATLADGQTRTVAIGQPKAAQPEVAPTLGLCPYCHTFCDGDCRS